MQPPDKPSKLHMFAYLYVLSQSLCSLHSDCASKLG
ncbi:putative signal peptide protein [Puccinia sorghi]|uniref:Putative signal peptide protein n=1 Tax=Puccinia sorghi TaxID=27349 RepID=A0A0L6UFI8_9BASI|nr:putative signal peptide protein [Puccinia sorghi]